MDTKKSYIIVKDRHPRISEVLNDCVSLCVPAAKNEPLSSILQKICAKITANNLIFENSPTIEFVRSGNEITANFIGTVEGEYPGISDDDDNCLVLGTDDKLYVPCPEEPVIPDAWLTTGNADTDWNVHYLGTSDPQGMVIKVGGKRAGLLTYSENGFNDAAFTAHNNVHLGLYAGEGSGNNITGNVAIGGGALRHNTSLEANAMIAIGQWAGHSMNGSGDVFGNRSCLIGYATCYRLLDGYSNTTLGSFTMERTIHGSVNTAIGRDSLRSNIDGSGNNGLGLFSLLYNSTGVRSIAVTNGGSGYTTATVTISAPPIGTGPGIWFGTATATAQISGGAIVGITVTSPGGGYVETAADYSGMYPEAPIPAGAVVTITGDGSGATATATVSSGDNNVGIGVAAGGYNILGQSNIHIGNLSGWGVLRYWDDNIIMIGTSTSVSGSVPATTAITNAIGIGKGATVTASNTMSIGGVGADLLKVGIGTASASERLHVEGNFRLANAFMPDNLPGTSGYLLASQGAGVAPIWIDPATVGGNFANTDLTLTGNRTHDGDGLALLFNNFDNIQLNATDVSFTANTTDVAFNMFSGGASSWQASDNININSPAIFITDGGLNYINWNNSNNMHIAAIGDVIIESDMNAQSVGVKGTVSGQVTMVATGAVGTPTLQLPTVSGTLVQYSDTSIASSATPTPTGNARENNFYVTALAANAVVAAPSGTPANGNTLLVRITDSGGPWTLGWNAIYRDSSDFTLPATTVAGETMYVQFVYNSTSTTWDAVGLTQGF